MFSLETWISVLAYPLNIAGRPTYSWPAFLIPAYEWTILWAGLSAAFGMLALNGLPSLYHPLFNAPNFRNGATTDKFFLCLEALDPKFDLVETKSLSAEDSRRTRLWRWSTDDMSREQGNKGSGNRAGSTASCAICAERRPAARPCRVLPVFCSLPAAARTCRTSRR